jgi:hypothetical protein
MKKYVGDIHTTEHGLVDNKKLSAKYVFPPADHFVVKSGESIVKEVILFTKQ